MKRPRHPRFVGALCAILVGIAALSAIEIAHARPAHAHDQLVRSNPEDGAVVDARPSAISLEFSDRLIDIGAAVHLVDDSGTTVAEAPPTINGPTVTQSVPPGLPDGAYRVLWRVVSSDGHPISGAFGFTIRTGQSTSSAAPDDHNPASNSSPPPAYDVGARPDNRHDTSDARGDDSSAGGGEVRQVLIALIGAAIGISIYRAVTLRRARRPRSLSSISHIPRRRSAKEKKEHSQ